MVYWILAAAAAIGGATLSLLLLEERIIFHPSRTIEMTPGAAGLPFEDLRLRSKDGETIAAWLIPAGSPIATVLFLHGNAGNISHRMLDLAGLSRAGFAVLILDYRGYGESSGSPSEKGIYIDGEAGWDELAVRRGIPPGRIVIYGESIGSAAALHLASDLARRRASIAPAAIVLEGAFTSGLDMGRRVFPFLPLRWIVRTRLDNLGAIRDVTAPTIFLHGTDDEIVPLEMGRRLFEASPARFKVFHEVRGARHNTVWATAGVSLPETLRAFVERAMKSP